MNDLTPKGTQLPAIAMKPTQPKMAAPQPPSHRPPACGQGAPPAKGASPVHSGEVAHHALEAHLVRLRAGRRRTERLLEVLCPGHTAADASVSVAWEKLFDVLCDMPPGEPAELNTLAGIIQKLSGAYNQIKGLEIKLRELEQKEAELAAKGQPTGKNITIDPEVLAGIEQQLGLL